MRRDPQLMRPPEVIDLRRLRLRRPKLSDAPAVFESASDPDVARYVDWPISTSIVSVEERLRATEHEWNWRNGYATEAACAIVEWIFSVALRLAAVGNVRCREPGVSSRSRESWADARGHFAARDRSSESIARAARCVHVFQGTRVTGR